MMVCSMHLLLFAGMHGGRQGWHVDHASVTPGLGRGAFQHQATRVIIDIHVEEHEQHHDPTYAHRHTLQYCIKLMLAWWRLICMLQRAA